MFDYFFNVILLLLLPVLPSFLLVTIQLSFYLFSFLFCLLLSFLPASKISISLSSTSRLPFHPLIGCLNLVHCFYPASQLLLSSFTFLFTYCLSPPHPLSFLTPSFPSCPPHPLSFSTYPSPPPPSPHHPIPCLWQERQLWPGLWLTLCPRQLSALSWQARSPISCPWWWQ